MAVFRKKEEEYDDLRDLKPENKRKRKEPPKPWGKKERYFVLAVFLATILTASFLALSARDFKLPGFPRFSINFKDWDFNLFKEETITIGKGVSIQKQKADKIIADFMAKTKGLSGTYALYVIDLGSSYSFGIDEEKTMQAASLIKLPVMLYAQGKVGDTKIEAMGKRSDNATFMEMRRKFGDDVLQNYIENLGMENTSLEDNRSTPKEMADLLKKIYDNKNEKILGYLTDTIFEGWLKKGVPSDVRVAHKYGRELHVVNDAGVVYANNPYVVIIMTQGIIEKEADQTLPELSKLVYDEMTK